MTTTDSKTQPEIGPRRTRDLSAQAAQTPGPERGSVEIEIGPEVGPDGRPTSGGWRYIGKKLREEMPFKSYKGRGGLTMSYITARQVQKRLDDIVGPGNWSSDAKPIRSEHPVSVQVGIGLYGVWKWDVGYSNNPDAVDEFIETLNRTTGEMEQKRNPSYEEEPMKAAVSDGFKRAAVQWGVGRWLYPEMKSQ